MTRRKCFFCGSLSATVYSRFTRRYYCADIPACNRRTKRKHADRKAAA